MARVMVTGGSGFVATWCLTQLLDAGPDVEPGRSVVDLLATGA